MYHFRNATKMVKIKGDKMNELEQQIINEVKNAIGKAIQAEAVGYNKPLSLLVADVVNKRRGEFSALIDNAITGALSDAEFVENFETAIKQKTASILISKTGGEIEKRVNELRANPATRARITLALEQAISDILDGD